MHPAYSVLAFTSLSGAGYGLLGLLCLLGAAGVVPAERWLGLVGFALAFGFVTGGLLASTFHLGHPERAWRAFSQWRSSWLSREGVVALATYLPSGLFAIGWVFFERTDGVWAVFGVLGALGAVLTVYCTGMIYQSLRTIRQWHNELVTPVYLLLALAGGALWLNALTLAFGGGQARVGWLAVGALAAGLAAKLAYWRSIDAERRTLTPGHATGLARFGAVRQWESAHTQENYVQREMGFQVARKHARKLRAHALLSGFAAPLALSLLILVLGGGIATAVLAVFAALIGLLGVLIERWLFFAEAQHVVTLYYGAESA